MSKVYDIFCEQRFDNHISLKPQEKQAFEFACKLDKNYNYKLSVVGQTDIPLERRTEDIFAVYYRKLDDSLISIDGQTALVFNAENQVKERACYLMIKSDFLLGKPHVFGLKYSANGVKNNFTASLEVFYGKKNTRYYYEQADEKYEIRLTDFDDFTILEKSITFNKEVDFVMLKIEAQDFEGCATVFAPYLTIDGENIGYPFEKSENFEDFNWIGEGFSLMERPKFSIKLNGEIVFEGRKAETCDCFSGVEFSLPSDLVKEKDNVLEIEYAKENVNAYEIKSVRLISMPKHFEVLAYDKTVLANKPFGVLVYSESGELPEIDCGENFEFLGANNFEKGYNVLRFKYSKAVKNEKIYIYSKNKKRIVTIKSVLELEEGDVITGSGDAIYVPQDVDDFMEYLAWYVNNNVGKLMTFRSNYRWGRNLDANDGLWQKIVPILCDMGIYYSVMIDGRELNGVNSSPDIKYLQSPYFLGEQTHEMDGSYTYWGQDVPNLQTEIFYHVLSKKMKKTGIYGKYSPVYNRQGVARMFYSDDYTGGDMQRAYEYFANNIKKTQEQGATRHTGVTPFFHTFLDNGYKWIGYESMYGNHELLLGAARGMSYSKNQRSFGVHAALQWSTMPLETKGHLLRYKISLNLSYMHGVTEINTEEGLWRFSNGYVDYDRFSKVCQDHLKIQSDFNTFVLKNPRKGKLKTNIAMVMGKYDGMDCFSCPNTFGQNGEVWKKSTPEDSWNLLKVFYPRADLNAIYYYVVEGGREALGENDKTLIETLEGLFRDIVEERPVGFYTETPYGVIDIISADCDNYEDYKFLFFTGWNTTSDAQLEKLCNFVENGGTLLLAKCHLTDSVDREKVLGRRAETINSKLVNRLLNYVDGGRVIFVDDDRFPIEYEKKYSELIRENAIRFGGQKVRNVNRISYTEYETDEGTTIYLQNIGWWTSLPASCEIMVGDVCKKVIVHGYDVKVIKI